MPRRVFITGTFDVANYGDLLFPLVAQEWLPDREVVAVSPTANRPNYGDAVQPVTVDAMMAGEASGVLVGGGYILIAQAATGLPTYAAAGVAEQAYPSLWLGAALAAATGDFPLLFNAPGAPFPYPAWRREMAQAALAAADYVSVRDEASRDILQADAEVVPDTVLGLERVWPRLQLLAEYRKILENHGFAPETRCLAVHVRGRALGEPGALAEAIGGLAKRHGLMPMLIATGPELGDLKVIDALAGHLDGPRILLTKAETLREIAGAIAGSALYLGGSMHGFVTSAVYGVPGVLVAIPSYGKYGGLVGHLDRRDDLARDWPAAIARADALLSSEVRPHIPAAVHAALDRHWARIRAGLDRPEAGRARRMTFLRRYMQHGAERFGAAWVVGPHLSARKISE